MGEAFVYALSVSQVSLTVATAVALTTAKLMGQYVQIICDLLIYVRFTTHTMIV